MVISLSAYCAGLVINDLADYEEDLRERPSRPLPSGAVSRSSALGLCQILASIAIITATCASRPIFSVAVILLGLILLYNLAAKKDRILGPVVMGLCRGVSVFLGMTAFVAQSHYSDVVAPLVICAYITGVSLLARTETSNPRIPPLIGKLISGLLFIQAGFCAYAGGVGWDAAFLLLALWPVSRLVASRFYAS
jgi:4-hydroxybenzoate polyprenyltransferase